MRVLHVTESMGAGTYTAIGQYTAVAPSDISHRVLARIRGDSFVRESWLDDVPHDLEPTLRGFVRQWLSLRHQDFDIIHAHSTLAGLLTRLAPHPHAQVVYSPHGLAAVHHRRAVVRRLVTYLEKILSRRTAAFAAVGASEEAELRVLAPGAPVVRLPHALGVTSRAVPRAERSSSVCCVGRLTYQKAPDTVADLPLRLAAAGLGDIECVWIGEGEPETRRLMEQHGWHVTGWVDRAMVDHMVATAVALLHPARYEGLSLAIAEALAHGTPVVARRIQSNLEFEGVQTFLTTDEAVDAVCRLLSDEDLWWAQSAAAMSYVETAHARGAQARSLWTLYRAAGKP